MTFSFSNVDLKLIMQSFGNLLRDKYLVSAPSTLLLPDRSQKTPKGTEIIPSVVPAGVKMAVYAFLETDVQLESEPPETDTADSENPEQSSERVKMSVVLSPMLWELVLSSFVIVMLGLRVSMENLLELS